MQAVDEADAGTAAEAEAAAEEAELAAEEATLAAELAVQRDEGAACTLPACRGSVPQGTVPAGEQEEAAWRFWSRQVAAPWS